MVDVPDVVSGRVHKHARSRAHAHDACESHRQKRKSVMRAMLADSTSAARLPDGDFGTSRFKGSYRASYTNWRRGRDAFLMPDDGRLFGRQAQMFTLAARHAVPAIHFSRDWVAAGGPLGCLGGSSPADGENHSHLAAN
jgi:hypothetical protein